LRPFITSREPARTARASDGIGQSDLIEAELVKADERPP